MRGNNRSDATMSTYDVKHSVPKFIKICTLSVGQLHNV